MDITALIQSCSKVGRYAYKTIIILGLGTLIFLQLPPPWDKPIIEGNVESGTYELLETELTGIAKGQRETMEQLSDLRGELEAATESIAGIRSTIEDEFANNLRSGDYTIESGILIDESKLITNEIEKRLRESN